MKAEMKNALQYIHVCIIIRHVFFYRYSKPKKKKKPHPEKSKMMKCPLERCNTKAILEIAVKA